MNYIIINNKIVPEKKALISVKERGFRFGDGIFESCKISSEVIYNFEAHFKRMEEGLEAIKINADLSNLKKLSEKLIIKNKIKNGNLRISISRGIGSMGYLPAKNITPLIVIETSKSRPLPKAPIHLYISSYNKISLNSLPINYKLMQGLNSILAKMEAKENDCFDSIMLNRKGEVCETSSANIFWVKDETLYTPDPACGLLLGTIREKIISLSPLKIKLAKAQINELKNAEEIFITNVNFGILAIDEIPSLKKKFFQKKYNKIFADLLNKDIKNYIKERCTSSAAPCGDPHTKIDKS